jgi:hypothetical protein
VRRHGNSVQRPASLGCSPSRVIATKRALDSPRFITGSPRASTPPTSRNQGPAWRVGNIECGARGRRGKPW